MRVPKREYVLRKDLFQEAKRFPRAKLEIDRELRETRCPKGFVIFLNIFAESARRLLTFQAFSDKVC